MVDINLSNGINPRMLVQSIVKGSTKQADNETDNFFDVARKSDEKEYSPRETEELTSVVNTELNTNKISSIGNIIDSAQELITEIFDNVQEVATDVSSAVGETATDIFDFFKTKVSLSDLAESIYAAKDAQSFEEWIKDFASAAVDSSALGALNETIKTQPKDKVSDSEISNTKEFNNLSNQDMLLLNNISYSGIATPENIGKTLGEISDELKQTAIDKCGKNAVDENGDITAKGVEVLFNTGYNIGVDCDFLATQTKEFQIFADILNQIANNDNLSELTILDNANVNDNGINVTTYGRLGSDGKLMENATVVFQGTIGNAGWQDNIESLTTVTPQQKAAWEYVQKQEQVLKDLSNESDIHLTVSGHSKGGNLAMFSTIESEKDTSNKIVIDNCLSFDGEGFNMDFVAENENIIDSCKSKITSIAAYVDPVNLLLQDIAGEKYYVGVDYMKLEPDTDGNPKIKEIDDLKKFIWDAHSPTSMYKKVCDDEQWTLYDECEMARLLKDISDNVENLHETPKSLLVATAVRVI